MDAAALEAALRSTGPGGEAKGTVWSEIALEPDAPTWEVQWSGLAPRAVARWTDRRPAVLVRNAGDALEIRALGSDRDAVESVVERAVDTVASVVAASSETDDGLRARLLRAARVRLLAEAALPAGTTLVREALGVSSDLVRFDRELWSFASGRFTYVATDSESIRSDSPWPRLAGMVDKPPATPLDTASINAEAAMAASAVRANAASSFRASWPVELASLPHLASLESIPQPPSVVGVPRLTRVAWAVAPSNRFEPWCVAGAPLLVGMLLFGLRPRRTGGDAAGAEGNASRGRSRSGQGESLPSRQAFLEGLPTKSGGRGRVIAAILPEGDETGIVAATHAFHRTTGRALRLSIDAGTVPSPPTDAGKPGLRDVLRGERTLEDVLAGDADTGWRIAAGTLGNDEAPWPVALSHLIDVLTRVFDPVVVGLGLPEEAAQSTVWCDATIVATAQLPKSPRLRRRLLERLAGAGIGPEIPWLDLRDMRDSMRSDSAPRPFPAKDTRQWGAERLYDPR